MSVIESKLTFFKMTVKGIFLGSTELREQSGFAWQRDNGWWYCGWDGKVHWFGRRPDPKKTAWPIV